MFMAEYFTLGGLQHYEWLYATGRGVERATTEWSVNLLIIGRQRLSVATDVQSVTIGSMDLAWRELFMSTTGSGPVAGIRLSNHV